MYNSLKGYLDDVVMSSEAISPTYNNIWYNAQKDEKVVLNMTCLMAWRKDDYVIFASDSYNTLNTGATRPDYTKIFPFEEQKCLIGIAGSNNFDWNGVGGEEIGNIIKEQILNIEKPKKDVLHTAINSLCRKLQYHIHDDGVTQILTAIPLELTSCYQDKLYNYIELRQFSFSKTDILEKVFPKEIDFVNVALNYVPLEKELKVKLWDNPEKTLRDIITKNKEIEELASKPPRIGGDIQMWKLSVQDGIENLSEEANKLYNSF